jgi:hypothetical protein
MTLLKSLDDEAVAYLNRYQVICDSSIRLTDPQSTRIARYASGQQRIVVIRQNFPPIT